MNDTLNDAPLSIRPDEPLLEEVTQKLLEQGYQDNGIGGYDFAIEAKKEPSVGVTGIINGLFAVVSLMFMNLYYGIH